MAAAEVINPGGAGTEAPASSPAVESTPVSAPVSAPESTPVLTDPQPGQRSTDYLRDAMSKLGEGIKTEEAKPAEPAAPVVPVVEEAKPAEVKPEETPAEVKPAESEKEENPLDKIGPLPAETLAKILQDNPKLEEAMAEAGLDKNLLFQATRDAAWAGNVRELYPTMEAAQMAHEAAGHFYAIDESLPAVRTVEDLDGFFMNNILPLTVLTDPATGEPLKNPNGTFQTDGTLSRLMSLTVDMDVATSRQILEQEVKAAGANAEEAQAMLDFMSAYDRFRQNGYRLGAPQPVEMTPEQRKTQERLDAQTKQLQEKETQTLVHQKEAHEDRVIKTTIEDIAPRIKADLDKTALDDYGKTKAAEDIYNAIIQKLEGDKNYRAEQSRIDARHKLTEDGFKKRVGQNLNWIKAIYPKVLEQVLQKAGARRVAQHQQRQQKIDTQIANSRMDPGRGAQTAQPGQAKLTDDQKFDKAKGAVLAETNGRMTSDFNARVVKKLLGMSSL